MNRTTDERTVDRILFLIACFFLGLFVLMTTFYVICPDRKCPFIVEGSPNR